MQFAVLQQYSFLFLLALVSIAFLYVINDFVMSIMWALVFTILFYPVYRKILHKIKSKNTAAGITITLILLVFFIPSVFVGGLVFNESLSLYQQISSQRVEGAVSIGIFEQFSDGLAYFEKFGVSENQVREKINSALGAGSRWLSSQAFSFGQRTFTIALQFFIMLYIIFFLFRDGDRIKQRIIDILPLGNVKEKRLMAKFTSTTRAVVKGTLIVGLVQGFLGGVLFYIAGIAGAALWGVLMTMLSVIPALGTGLVWAPAGIILLLTGNIWQGIFVLVGGTVIVGTVDNILRPILVGRDTQIPDVFVLISTLGGLAVFGITGFVIGPVLAGFFLVMWEMFEETYKKDLELHG